MQEPIRGGMLVLLTISLSLGIFMNVLDSSIANVAVPSIAGDLGVSADEGTWVITSFAVTSAIMLPLTGWLARRFGEVRLFVVSTALFTLTSLLCGLSENLTMLIIFRVIQGAVAGPMIPLSQSLLLANYPDDKKGLATSLWAMTAVVAPIFGPILGGWITDNYTWPWIFYINLPIGIFSAYVTWRLLKNRETKISKPRFDAVGLFLMAVGIGCLQVLLDKGQDLDWFNSNAIITLAITSFICLAFFIVWELTDTEPVVDLTLFKNRNFAIGTLVISLGYMAFFGNVVIFPLWLQTQMGYTPTWAGVAAAPIGVFSLLLSPFVGQMINRFDLRVLASVSFIIFAGVSFWNSSFNTDVSFTQLVIPRFVMGIGVAFYFTPLISIILYGMPGNQIASALGIANFLRILGGSFGTSLSVALWERREAFHHSHLTQNITNLNPFSLRAVDQLHHLGFTGLKAYQQLVLIITNQAFMLAINDVFWVFGWIFLILLGCVWLTNPTGLAPGQVRKVVAE